MTDTLILTPFRDALESLKQAVWDYNIDGGEYIRDACIKRFEYTYELSHKMLKRHLKMTASAPVEIDQLTFQGLIRLGYKQGLLLNSWDRWLVYRDNRNKTAHGYNEENALAIVAELENFVTEMEYVLQQLEKHTQS